MQAAPADAAYKDIGVAAEDKKPVENAAAPHPAIANPMTPSFPRPFGLGDEAWARLAEQKVLHAYHGVTKEIRDFVNKVDGKDAEDEAKAAL
jgi:hypothetical protein